MKRNKKLLISFLALNAILSSYPAAASSSVKYEKMYNSIVKNIEKGNSSDKTYQTIEKILNQKNKELKDLYLQGDYIVKPEYLEWQVFFTGFYEEYNEGVDNSKENARYHSKVTGYYDASGNYVTTGGGISGMSGKPYQPLQQPKDINLGVSIPLKGMTREPLSLALSPAQEININPNVAAPGAPNSMVTPFIDTFKFSIVPPVITPPTVTIPPQFSVSVPNTGNWDESFNCLSGTCSYTSKIGQYNLTSGVIDGTWNSDSLTSFTVTNLLGTIDPNTTAQGHVAGASYANITTPLNVATGTGNGAYALYKQTAGERYVLGTSGDVNSLTMIIRSNVAAGYSGTLPHLIQIDPHYPRSISTRTYTAYTEDYYGRLITQVNGQDHIERYSELINHGTLKGIGNSLLIVGLQMHDGEHSPTVKNYGLMLGEYDSTNPNDGGERHVANTFMAPQSNTSERRWEFYNMPGGKIELQVKESIAYNFGTVTPPSEKPHLTIFNDGDIVLYGRDSVGIKTGNASNELTYSKIILNTPIRINGDRSVGVEIAKLMDSGYGNVAAGAYDPRPAQIKVTIGGEANNYAGNAPSYDNSFVEEAIGLYINKSTLNYRLGYFDFKFGDYAKNSTLITISNGKLYLDNNNTQEIEITKGQNNFGVIVTGASSELTLAPDIKIGTTSVPVNGTIALYAGNSGKIHFDTSNNIETNGEGSHAVILTGTGTVLNDTASGFNHNFTATGKKSALLYAANIAAIDLSNSSQVNIKASGDESIGVYTNNGTIKLGMAGTGTGNYEIGTNGVLFYSDGVGTGRIETSGTSFTVGDGSLFTRITTPSTTPGNEQIKFTHTTGHTNLNLLSGGIGFVYTGDGVTSVTPTLINSYFSNNYSGLNNMDVTVNSGARLYVIEKYATMNLSAIGVISAPSTIFNDITNNGGSKAFLLRGTLALDPSSGTVNLDSLTEDYNLIEKALTGITVNGGVTVSGSNANQVALMDDNSYENTLYVKMNNNGTIALNGANSTGIYANRGEIKNNGLIQVTGDKNIGIFSENGTDTENLQNINIGNNGVGIYAISHQNPGSLPSGTIIDVLTGTIKVKNSGTIAATTGNNAIGIYAENNKTGGVASESQIDLASGTINLGASENAIGVYVDKGTAVSSGSTITVGKNGVAFYAKDSDVTFNGITINLNGDNAIGLFLDGTSSLATTGTNTINIDGKNIILFNINSSGTINNNFIVNSVTVGSTYTLGNVTGGIFDYTGSSTLASNGTLVSGKNSAIYLNIPSVVTSASGSVNVAAVALDGQYTPLTPFPAGMTAGTDGENAGTITLGDGSVGIYGKNSSRISNKGSITAGNASAGLMTSGTGSFILNSGTITVGTGSQGIYLKDGDYAYNTGSGNIVSSGAGTVGIYANNTALHVTNDGNIDLTGDKSIGIYSIGAVPQNINNNSILKIGDSTNTSDPSIGIYSAVAGSTVTNAGTVISGINSIGIYNNQGIVNSNGTANIGNSGVGIYSTGGTVNLNAGSTLNMGTNGAVAVYGVYSAVTNSTNLNIGNSNYGFILKGGTFTNGAGTNSSIGTDSVYMYSTEGTTVINDGTLIMSGSDNVGFYMAQDPVSGVGGAAMTNNAGGIILGTTGNNNVGIYNYGGTVDNFGTVAVGDSDIVFVAGTTNVDVQNSKYSVGIYGENAAIVNHASGNISAGYGGYGIVAKGGTASNFGTVTTTGDYSTGMYTENGIITNEAGGFINVSGDNTIGMAGKGAGSQIINHGTINITGNDAIGMYGNLGTIITNTGTINISGLNSKIFVSSDPDDTAHSVGAGTATINGGSTANVISSLGSVHSLPALINAGIIKSNGVLALDGVQVMIKPDPTTAQPSSDPNYDFELSGTSIIADEVLTSKPIVILPGFSDGTIADVYKLEGLINASSGQYDFVSGSLLWEATPKATSAGADVYMSRKAFTDFTDGLWFEDFGTALENNYLSATGDAVKIYNKTAYITNETEFRQVMASLAGNVYANINQREYDIAKALEDSLHLLQDSTNNTKENVKISIIAGKGKNKEETDGVVAYDYTTTGVLALREVERTYKHTFGYSLGYVHTGFEFKDGNESEEWVDTIQLGVHNKYQTNGWEVRNDLTGRASIHNVDRNIDWPSPLERSEMNGTYETYSITSDNILGKKFGLGKKASIMPYGAFKAMYVTRPSFEEKGLEALEVEGNDAWSAKPRAGVELKGAVPLGSKTAWQLKGTLDLAYEYELADLNEREKARLIAIEDGYHKLSKPEDEKGTFRTRAAIGVEVEDRYGIFLTGEYSTGNDKEDDYRAGVTLKAVF